MVLWFYVQELPKAQSTDWEKPGIEPATPGLQDIGLHMIHLTDFDFHCTCKHFKNIMNLEIYTLTFIDVSFF